MHTNIRIKLIVSLLLANGILALGIYAFAVRRIDNDYLNYINQAQNEKLAPFVTALGRKYVELGGWQWINDDRELWRQLVNRYVMGGEKQGARSSSRPPLPDLSGKTEQTMGRGPLDMDLHFQLRDSEGELVIGALALMQEARWLPIRYDGKVVGELGVISMTQVTQSANAIFIQEQKRTIGYMVLGLVLTAIIISLILARHFQKSLNAITQGVRRLVSGDYEKALKMESHDEFGQLANDYNLLRRTLKENQESRRQWIADISHELRTPVTIMQGELDAILDGVRKMDKECIVSLQQEARRLGNLIADLHELSMSDLGALVYNKNNLNLGNELDKFFECQKQVISSAGMKIQVKLPQKPVNVFADADRLDQLFMNLLQNTLRYTDKPGTLEVSLHSAGQEAEITWEDSAPGMAVDEMPRLFERFYRGGQARTGAEEGSGLGMSISKNIVDAHNGKISLYESSLGGLGIRISLPLMQQS